MSVPDFEALAQNFANWRIHRFPTLSQDKAFERYTIEQILKDYNLTDAEIISGNYGQTDDGGVDGIYFFAGDRLITTEAEIPEGASAARLVIVQSTYSTAGFSEARIEKFYSFCRDLLDYQTPPSDLDELSPDARKLIGNFRVKYQPLAAKAHSLHVSFFYAANTTVSPTKNRKIPTRFNKIEKLVKSHLTNATIDPLELWNCTTLIKQVRQQPEIRHSLGITSYIPPTTNKDVVCLAKISEFYKFIKGKDGELRTGFFEPNVRDYQGKRNPVNKDIRSTLEETPVQEFWWLNNGVTILASDAGIAGDRLTVENPEIVNGLQTSWEIFSYFKEKPDKLQTDSRNIMLRIIRPPDEKASSLITKATNFQTEVKGLSLHANEQIHYDIEDKLLKEELFYDRKKGRYKTLQKPADSIVSVMEMARAVIAILLRRPDDARARPQTLLSDNDSYVEIFAREKKTEMYLGCILLDRATVNFLENYPAAEPEEKRDVRYYLDMWIACQLTNSAKPTDVKLCVLAATDFSSAQFVELMEKSCNFVLARYRKLGGEEIAKGPKLTLMLQKSLNQKLRVK